MILNAVYYAKGYDYSVNPVAIKPVLSEHQAVWYDTSDRMKKVTINKILSSDVLQATDKQIDWHHCPPSLTLSVQTPQGSKLIVLTLMTVDVYNQKVRFQVAGSPEFRSDEEVQSYYLTMNFNNYKIV